MAFAQQQAPPVSSSGNPLLPKWNEIFDFAKIDTAAIRSASAATDKAVAAKLAEIAAVDDKSRTFENTLRPFDDLLNEVNKATSVYELLVNTHPDKAIRDRSGEKLEYYTGEYDELNLNEPLYKAVKAYSNTKEAKALTGEKAYFLKKTLRDFERNGMNLSLSDRDTLKTISKRLNELSVAFNKNISTDTSSVIMTEQEITGCSDDFKKEHKLANGNYRLDLSNPTYIPFMSYAQSADARKKLLMAKQNIAAPQNETVLAEILRLRDRKAKLLGYPTYSAYATGDIMAQNPKNVLDFENKLATDLRPKAQADLDELLKIKSKETGKTETTIYPYDVMYYSTRLLEQKYSVDPEKVREYFEMQNVIKGIFGIYQKLYNLSFVEDKHPSVWHSDVQAFSVFDNATKQEIGYFYLDLYPRENKYNHAACFPLTGSKVTASGKQIRSAALVCNFAKATADKPSLLTHPTVVTFLHEFGHLMHSMVSETELAAFSGTNVATDFVEAPSQIMENWAWQKSVLSGFAKHYKTGEVIPDDLLDKMIASKNANSGLLALQQVFYGSFDFALNNGFQCKSPQDIVDKVKETQNKITFYPFIDGTHFACSFGHLTGYGSKYYGYLWSQVYAQDMFSVFEKEGVLSPATGARYRKEVLAKGGSDDAINLVKNFLGREPNNKAFLRNLGLKTN